MRFWMCFAVLSTFTMSGAAQEKRPYDQTNQLSVFAEYSNDSSHIFLGQAMSRKLTAAGGSYSRRLRGNRFATWRWQFDVRPFVLLRSPFLENIETVSAIDGVYPITVDGPFPGTYEDGSLQVRECVSSSGSGTIYGTTGTGGDSVPVETIAYTAICSHPLTYGGGVSPLGQTVNFFTRHRLQPYFSANAGFVMFDKITPSEGSTRFNFTFEGGFGFQYYVKPSQAISIDYRYHHISNAGIGAQNPGMDSGTLKIAYLFGR